MADVNKSRRSFMRAIGVAVGGGVGTLAAGQAHAFRLLPADDYATLLENACVTDEAQRHRELLTQVQNELGIKLDEEKAQEILRQMSCPTCGCNLQLAYNNYSDLSGF